MEVPQSSPTALRLARAAYAAAIAPIDEEFDLLYGNFVASAKRLRANPKRRKLRKALDLKDGYDAIVRQKDNIGKNINGWLVSSAWKPRFLSQ